MKLAIISPILGLEYSAYGSMDMALTHLVLQNEQYATFYRKRSEQGMHIILDNGAFECESTTGKGFDPADVLVAAKMIKATELICTDVLFEGQNTVDSTRQFIKFLETRGELGNYLLQAVPQGKSANEWLNCYMELVCMSQVSVIGFSKLSVPQSFLGCHEESRSVSNSRRLCVQKLQEYHLTPDVFDKTVHLLGGDDGSPSELKYMSSLSFIRSNDTSAPIQYGIYDVLFDIVTGYALRFVGDKPDLSNQNDDTEISLNTKRNNIYHNIIVFYKFMSECSMLGSK